MIRIVIVKKEAYTIAQGAHSEELRYNQDDGRNAHDMLYN